MGGAENGTGTSRSDGLLQRHPPQSTVSKHDGEHGLLDCVFVMGSASALALTAALTLGMKPTAPLAAGQMGMIVV